MRLTAQSFLLLLVPVLFSCQFPDKRDQQGETPKKADLSVPEPTTYCEKSWHCSYETLIQEEARSAMIQKRKAFVTACEDALRKMPEDVVKKYESCTRAACGDELQKCLLQQLPVREPPVGRK